MDWTRRVKTQEMLAMGGALGLLLGLVLGYYLAQGQWDRQCVLEKKVMIAAAAEREEEWAEAIGDCMNYALHLEQVDRQLMFAHDRCWTEHDQMSEALDAYAEGGQEAMP